MNKLLTTATIFILATVTAVAAPGDERQASSPLLAAASEAGIEDGLFTYCRHYADLTICKMMTGNMAALRDKPFDAGGCQAPHKKNSVKFPRLKHTIYTCVMKKFDE